MGIEKLLKPLYSWLLLRSEYEAREASLREQMRQFVDEIRRDDLASAEKARQEQGNVIEMLRQENQNLRQELANAVDMLRGENQNLSQEIANAIDMLRGEHRNLSQELANAIDMLRFEDRNLHYDTYTRLLQEAQNRVDEVGLDLVTLILQTRLALALKDIKKNPTPNVSSTLQKLKPEHFDVYLDRFKKLHPSLYKTWASANFGVNLQEYKNNPETSCAVATRENVRLFRGFAAPYLEGRILDVGCGPYSIPHYLLDYPVELISGIDPIAPFEPHPFEFVQGFAEFLPWNDSTFDVLIAATSLDHVLSLDLALHEMRRVLKPKGILLVWDWFGEKTEPYNPSNQAPQLIDRYHLFNFSEDWFEEMMMKHFSIEEKLRLYGKWSRDRFYALRLEKK